MSCTSRARAEEARDPGSLRLDVIYLAGEGLHNLDRESFEGSSIRLALFVRL
jgi:hypothetical protein